MQVIEVIETMSSKGSIVMGVAYVLFMITLTCIAVQTLSSREKAIRTHRIIGSICFFILIVLSVWAVFDESINKQVTQYEAIVTNFEVLEENGYTVVEHKKDDLYILEKVGK